MIFDSDGSSEARIAARGRTPELASALADWGGAVTPVGSTGVPSLEPLVTVTAGERTWMFPTASTPASG